MRRTTSLLNHEQEAAQQQRGRVRGGPAGLWDLGSGVGKGPGLGWGAAPGCREALGEVGRVRGGQRDGWLPGPRWYAQGAMPGCGRPRSESPGPTHGPTVQLSHSVVSDSL